ncbi:hypothetical protein EG329_006204 [Mollisiaceae sp. DMI_Dod_QoI]|nr:hypothetical protein EG329_006204 [Helotiales sp. DMI_Dod_QoI]
MRPTSKDFIRHNAETLEFGTGKWPMEVVKEDVKRQLAARKMLTAAKLNLNLSGNIRAQSQSASAVEILSPPGNCNLGSSLRASKSRTRNAMVVPLFGWSAGDLVTSIKILCAIARAFKEASGAKSQYTETASWLESFASDLERIKEYITENPDARYTKNIVEQVARIDKHYAEFETYLQNYDKGLSSSAETNSITATIKKVKWTLKELKGKIDSLKFAVNGPLVSLNLLLALQFRYDLSAIAEKVTHMPPMPRISDIETAFQGIHDRIHLLQDVQQRVKADLAREHLMIKDEVEQCISAASANILESHREATTEVLNIIEAKDTAWMVALSTMQRHLEDIGETQSRTQRFYTVLRSQQQELDKIKNLLEANDELEGSVKDLHQELSTLTLKSRESNLLEMTQAVGAVANLAAGLANMFLVTTVMKMLGGVQNNFCAFTSSKNLAHMNFSHGHGVSRTFQELPRYPFEQGWEWRGWTIGRDAALSSSLETPHQVMIMLRHLFDEGIAQGQMKNYFLPAEGIHPDVLRTDAPLYLLQHVTISGKVNMGVRGYLIRASTCFAKEMLSNLKEDSAKWIELLEQKRHLGHRSSDYMSYDIFKARWQPLRAAIQEKITRRAEEMAEREKAEELERDRKKQKQDERGLHWVSSFQDGLRNSTENFRGGRRGSSGSSEGGGGGGGGAAGAAGATAGRGGGAAAISIQADNYDAASSASSNQSSHCNVTEGSQNADGPIISKLEGSSSGSELISELKPWTPKPSKKSSRKLDSSNTRDPEEVSAVKKDSRLVKPVGNAISSTHKSSSEKDDAKSSTM